MYMYKFECRDLFGFIDNLELQASSYDEAFAEVESFGVYVEIEFVGMRGI